MEGQEARQRATRQVEAKLGFYVHAVVYVVVSALLVVVNLKASPADLWFQWPLLGWGVGILMHGLNVFVFEGRSPVRERLIERELRKSSASRT
ncbi:MAG: 2TM domain-containing protein [Gemmatimonadota bacterium]